MSRPPSTAHARVIFESTAARMDGSGKHVLSGYRPIYDVRPDYWTSAIATDPFLRQAVTAWIDKTTPPRLRGPENR